MVDAVSAVPLTLASPYGKLAKFLKVHKFLRVLRLAKAGKASLLAERLVERFPTLNTTAANIVRLVCFVLPVPLSLAIASHILYAPHFSSPRFRDPMPALILITNACSVL